MIQGTKPFASLSARICGAIASRCQDRAEHISMFVDTGYSFEEWLNWESFIACSESGWKVSPRPSYAALGVENCGDYADLLVTEANERVLVEIGLVTKENRNKWQFKLERDVNKLTRHDGSITPLQLILLVSTSRVDSCKNWQRWFGKVPCWSRLPAFEHSRPLGSLGEMIFRAW